MRFMLRSVGKFNLLDNELRILIDKKYIKCMHKISSFSHLHVFYGERNMTDEKSLSDFKDTGVCLKERNVKILDTNDKEGIITIENNIENNFQINNNEVFDIKPYMPSEDCIMNEVNGKNTSRIVILDRNSNDNEDNEYDDSNDDKWFIKSVFGNIRNVNKEIYIEISENEFDKLERFDCKYLKIFWWFNKFESDTYRSAVECNPPYENAPRSGIFLTRSPVRPNPIAFTIVKVKKYDYENKRIYLNGIEAYDMTPCLGIEEYNSKLDMIKDSSVPNYLSHWSKYINEDDMYKGIDDLSIHDSMLDKILDNENEIQAKEFNEVLDEMNKECEEYEDKVDAIRVKGARTNNLKNIDVSIPYREISAVVGVSGSGKSSLVNDTIYAECRRKMEYLNSNKNVFPKPDADFISGTIPALLIKQREIRGNSLSTVGTYTDAYDYLRIIYSIVGKRHCPSCGNEIVPLSIERIVSIVKNLKLDSVYDIFENEIFINDKICNSNDKNYDNNFDSALRKILEKCNGAIKIKCNNEYVLLQTKQKCYHCDKIMFEISPSTFSYLDPESRCQSCNGLGFVFDVDEEKLIFNQNISILDGALDFYGKLRNFINKPNANWMKGQIFGLADKYNEDLEKPWKELSKKYRDAVIFGLDEEVTFKYNNKSNGRNGEITRKVEGVKEIIKRLYNENANSKAFDKYLKRIPCHDCNGERLNKEGRIVTINGYRYPEVSNMTFDEIKCFVIDLKKSLNYDKYEKLKNVLSSLYELAEAAENLGIGYIRLSQSTQTLSGGEAQRLKLLSAYINHLSGILYVLDEPSKGLDKDDYSCVINLLEKLKRENNTILMVEHNEDMIRCADNIIEIGPSAGEYGGQVVSSGSFKDVISDENTQMYKLFNNKNYRIRKYLYNNEAKFINLTGLNKLYLKNIDVSFPINALTCICGRSGCGKSTLLKQEIYPRLEKKKEFSKVIMVDQSQIGKNSKSIIATYTGIMDIIRNLMSKTDEACKRGYDSSYFSFNSENGKCLNCKGNGKIEVKYLQDMYIKCPDCNGKRYKKEILDIKYRDKNIDEIFNLSLEDAKIFFEDQKEIINIVKSLEDVGLSYLKLGQATQELSGGESQRLKLASELSKAQSKNVLYLLDEPTTGLHYTDINNLIKLIDRIVNDDNTVIVIEHNKQFVENCDYKIVMGPGAGKDGGRILTSDWIKE